MTNNHDTFLPGIFTVRKPSAEWNSQLVRCILQEWAKQLDFPDRDNTRTNATTINTSDATYGLLPDGIWSQPVVSTNPRLIDWKDSRVISNNCWCVSLSDFMSYGDDASMSFQSLGGWILKVHHSHASDIKKFITAFVLGLDAYLRNFVDGGPKLELRNGLMTIHGGMTQIPGILGYHYIYPVFTVDGNKVILEFRCLESGINSVLLKGDNGLFKPDYIVDYQAVVHKMSCCGKCDQCNLLIFNKDDLPLYTNQSQPTTVHKIETYCRQTESGSRSYPHTVDVDFMVDNPSSAGPKVKQFLGIGNPVKKSPEPLKEQKDSIYSKEEKSNTKKQIAMATTKKSSMFDRLMSKFKGQFIPRKVTGFGVTMDGTIAIQGSEEWLAIEDNTVVSYPDEVIFKECPVYAITKDINDVKVGDIVLTSNGITGKQTAGKVTYINRNKEKTTITGLTVVAYNGSEGKKTVIKDKLTGLKTVEVLFNVMDLMQQGVKGDGKATNTFGLNPMAFMFLMDNGGDADDLFTDKNMMLLMMMSTMGKGEGGGMDTMGQLIQQNPMMFMLLAGGKDLSTKDMFLMSMMMGGKNPFALGK